jgi:hypothetical protein
VPARLRLPLVLSSVVVGAVAVTAVACGGPSETEYFYCAEPYRPDAAVVAADAGPPADAAVPDAARCGFVVEDPAQCPPGCEPEPLG